MEEKRKRMNLWYRFYNSSMIFLFLAISLLGLSCEKGMENNELIEDQSYYFPSNSNANWESIDIRSLGWNLSKVEELKSFLNDSGTRAFIVLKDGRIAIEHYNGNTLLGQSFNRNSQWYWASAGKTLTSFLVGIAEKKGFLSLEDSSVDYLGKGWSTLTPEQEKEIKIYHHLSMTTGMDENVPNDNCTSPECFVYKTAPGNRWNYHNAPYTILDRVIESATGMEFETFFEQELKEPIGMSGQWTSLGDNNVYFSNALSMARFGSLVINKGKWKDLSILSDGDYIEEMHLPSQDINSAYGYLWWLNGYSPIMLPGSQIQFQRIMTPSAPADMYAAIGKNSQYLNIVPSKGLVVVRLGDKPGNDLVPIQLQEDIWQYLNEIIPE